MNSFAKSTALILGVVLLLGNTIVQAQSPAHPRVFLIDLGRADKPTDPAVIKADRDAAAAAKIQVASVVTKKANPPSGDKHDYMSQAPYFWKNPDTPNGLPYIRRDGERNPEIKQYPDHDLLDQMVSVVDRLAIGYYRTRKEAYAARAAEILRMWFINPDTKMNPNLEYAQAIPGLNTGRGIGIIETRGLTRVVDAVGLLAGSPSWTKADQAGMEAWFSKYLTWLTESKNGRDESAAKNNHGTFYDVQAADFALFTGNTALAKQILENAKQKRFAAQIEPDGRQPLELDRTKSWDYSTMNLDGLISLAILGDHVGVDLWKFQTSDGRSLRKAILYLEPFAKEPAKWKFKQISPLEPQRFYSAAAKALKGYKDAEFQKMFSVGAKAVNDKPSTVAH
jgi:hypothetical protein